MKILRIPIFKSDGRDVTYYKIYCEKCHLTGLCFKTENLVDASFVELAICIKYVTCINLF